MNGWYGTMSELAVPGQKFRNRDQDRDSKPYYNPNLFLKESWKSIYSRKNGDIFNVEYRWESETFQNDHESNVSFLGLRLYFSFLSTFRQFVFQKLTRHFLRLFKTISLEDGIFQRTA